MEDDKSIRLILANSRIFAEESLPTPTEVDKYLYPIYKDDLPILDGYSIVLNPRHPVDLVPNITDDIRGSGSSLDKLSALYMKNLPSFLQTLLHIPDESYIYQYLADNIGSDQEIVKWFSSGMNTKLDYNKEKEVLEASEPQEPEDLTVTTKPPEQTELQEPQEKQDVNNAHQIMQPSPQPSVNMYSLDVDYTKMQEILAILIKKELEPFMSSVNEQNSNDNFIHTLVKVEDSSNNLIKSVNAISDYIVNLDDDRKKISSLVSELVNIISEQRKQFGSILDVCSLLNAQQGIVETIINRYSNVSLLTTEERFLQSLNRLDQLSNPAKFMRAFKEVLKQNWYSGDRLLAEQMLCQTLNFLKGREL